MAEKTIYFDESGYTGSALLDPVQPYFTVASTDLSEAEARELLNHTFPGYGGREFKFQAMWRRDAYRERFIEFGAELGKLADRTFLWCIDKKFCVLTKLVDSLIEPLMYVRGYDFYADGHAPKFCNYVYAGIMALGGEALYDATVDGYAEFARNPNNETLEELGRRLRLMAKSVDEDISWFYELAVEGAERFHELHDLDTFAGSFDIQFTSVLASVGYWRSKSPDDFRVLHDDSSNFFRQEKLWEAVTAADVPPQVHDVSAGPAMEFPLRVVDTTACNSAEHLSIQLCDLLAGLVCKIHRRTEADSDLIARIVQGGFGELSAPGIRPSDELPQAPPARRNGPDAVDLLTAVMFRERS